MSDSARALDLLAHDVPMALLFDIAGFGPSSEELYRAEGSRIAQTAVMPRPEIVAVAS